MVKMLLNVGKTGGLKIHENGNVEGALAINLEVRRAPENCTVILENTSNVEKMARKRKTNRIW
jgi:hypothetical protein